jgi:hypothetical protein
MAKDLNQIAAGITALTTGTKVKEEAAKNPAAVALGRLGGLKGGKARAASMGAAERSEIAKKAAQARWKTGEAT